MSKFDEFMNDFRYDPETFKPDEFKSAAQAAYQEDITGVTSVAASKDAEIAERDNKIKELGLANWNMLMKQGPPIPEGQTPQILNPDGTSGEAAPRSIESFFTKKE